MSEKLKDEGEQISGGQGADWDELKKVPFAGFGNQERQKLAEEGRIKETGAYVLGEQREVIGVAPSLPEQYEKTNMEYERTMGGELEFLQNYLEDKREFLEGEGEREVQGDVLEAVERRSEQGVRLKLETQYVADLARYFRTANEVALTDLSKGDIVFEKIKSDIARTSKEASEGDGEAAARRKVQQRIFGVLRAKFEHGARFEGSEEGFVPVYEEDDVSSAGGFNGKASEGRSGADGDVEEGGADDDAMEDEKMPFGTERKRSEGYGDEELWRRMREHDEMRKAERGRNRRYEEDKKRSKEREELRGSQEELEDEMEM